MMPHEEVRFSVKCKPGEQDCDGLDTRLSVGWLRVAVAAVFAGQGMALSLALNMTPPPAGSTAYWFLHGGLIFSTLVVLIFLGGPLFGSTLAMVRERRLSIEGLFMVSALGAFFGSVLSSLTASGAVYYEVVSIVIAIYTIGRMLGERSQGRVLAERDRLRERFDRAELWVAGHWQSVEVNTLSPGDRVRVAPGAPVTVDGRVLSGEGYVRESAMTGEPLPVVRCVGDRVRAGTWSVDGVFEIEVLSAAGERELDAILKTVGAPGGRPSEMQGLANRLIQWFLPLVAGVSFITGLYWLIAASWVEAMLNSMAVLLVACPCALGLATPAAVWQGLFLMGRLGLVSRDGALIDVLAGTQRIFFDKTGTLTDSSLRVTEYWISPEWREHRHELSAAVHAVESRFDHPVARALKNFLEPEVGMVSMPVSGLRMVPGKGVEAKTGCGDLSIGAAALCPGVSLEAYSAVLPEREGKRIFVFIDGNLSAILILSENMRPGLKQLFSDLALLGVDCCVLTGDPEPQVALPEGLPMQCGCSAAEKKSIVRIAAEKGALPVFVGDGVNDLSAMSVAAASLSMSSGVALARFAASGQFSGDRVDCLPEVIRLARRIRQRLRGNLYFAVCYNILGMGLAALGWLHPVAAAVIMLVSSFLVTARALGGRATYYAD